MRDASRMFFLQPVSLCWLVSLLCAAPTLGAGVNATIAPSALQQSAAQQRLPGQSAPKKAALQGIVRDSNGKPVIGATMILRNLATDQKFEKVSGSQGVFRFIDVAPGAYELKIIAAGFQEFMTAAVQLKPGDDLVREIVLVAMPSAAPASPQFPRLPAGTTNPQIGSQPAPPPTVPPNTMQNGNLEQTGQQPAPESLPSPDQVFHPEPDRWSVAMPDWDRYGIGGEHPYVKGSKWDPFNRNKLKGDVPIIGKQTFLNLTATSDTFLDGRRLPTPTDVSSARPGSSDFFGRGNQLFLDQTFAFSFDLFHGDTSFRPVDWRIRITPVISLNYLDVQELGVVNVDVPRAPRAWIRISVCRKPSPK